MKILLPASPFIFAAFSLSLAWAGPTPGAGSAPASLDLGSWRLETLKGSSAALTNGKDGPSGSSDVMVEAQNGGSGEKWLVQMDYPISVVKGKTYHLKFMAKSDPDHYVYIGCTTLAAPYTGLADGKSLQLSGEWQQIDYSFTPKADEAEARILVTNLNAPGSKFFIADMTLDTQ